MTRSGLTPMRGIYLDYNATTPVADDVREAMLPFFSEHFGNPSSGHALGRAAREGLEDARSRLARSIGAAADEVLYTSGGTESNNLAILGRALCGTKPGHLVISAIEHPAVAQPASLLQRWGHEVSVIGCNREGIVRTDEVAQSLRPDTLLVSIMHANNEVGSVQPIRDIAALCRSREIPCHVDAAQSLGKIPVDVEVLGVDLLSIAGHKVYAPKGIGALYARRGTVLCPVLRGAGQERGLRPGTENVAFAVGLGRAAELAVSKLKAESPRLASLRDRLLEKLREGVGAELVVHGPARADQRLPNTLSVAFPRVDGNELLGRAPEIHASTGAACHTGHTRVSTTLAAMGLDAATARGTVRLSVGWFTDQEQVDAAAAILVAAWEHLAKVKL